jgi:drug/metabolite transporter (DMT)-like permease
VDALSKRQIIADFGLLVITAIWGATFVMVQQAVNTFPVFGFLALRFGLALLCFAPILAARWVSDGHGATAPRRPLNRQAIGAGIVIGLALFAGYSFQTFGLRLTTPAKTGFITGLSVVMVPLFSAFLLRQPPRQGAAIGVVLATAGLALMSLQGDLSLMAGDLIVLACAVAFALHIVATGKFAPRLDSLTLVATQIATVATLSLIASWIWESHWPAIQSVTLQAALFTGVTATAIAFGVQTLAQRFTTPTHTALIFAMEPVWAGLFSFWLIGEVLGPRALIGGGLIVAGMLAAELLPSLHTARFALSKPYLD